MTFVTHIIDKGPVQRRHRELLPLHTSKFAKNNRSQTVSSIGENGKQRKFSCTANRSINGKAMLENSLVLARKVMMHIVWVKGNWNLKKLYSKEGIKGEIIQKEQK